MSNQYYMNTASIPGSAPILPAYADSVVPQQTIQYPKAESNSNNSSNNNNNNNNNNVRTLIPTIIAIILAIVAIALSITANNNATTAKSDAKAALTAFSIIPTSNNNNNNNNPSSSSSADSSSAIYAQALYTKTGGTNGEISVPGRWFHDDSVAPPLTVPEDGVYMVSTTCRAYLNSVFSYWSCRLIRNNDIDFAKSLTVTYGGVVATATTGNGDNSVSGFWIGKLLKGDIIRQQYMIDGPTTSYNTYARNQGSVGYSSIQIIRIGAQ